MNAWKFWIAERVALVALIMLALQLHGCASVPRCDDGYSAQVCEADSDRGVL